MHQLQRSTFLQDGREVVKINWFLFSHFPIFLLFQNCVIPWLNLNKFGNGCQKNSCKLSTTSFFPPQDFLLGGCLRWGHRNEESRYNLSRRPRWKSGHAPLYNTPTARFGHEEGRLRIKTISLTLVFFTDCVHWVPRRYRIFANKCFDILQNLSPVWRS